jgi:Helix-turn-helix
VVQKFGFQPPALGAGAQRPSRAFIIAVKLADRPAWRIAAEAGVSPTTLSRLMSGSLRARPNDSRLLRVAKVLGVPADQVFDRTAMPPADGA